MAFILILLALLTISALAPLLGSDSRGLRDHPWEHLRQ
jgi:hypothetical protein